MPWRKILLFMGLALGLLVTLLFFLSILISNYYGRMRDDEALNTFQISLPTMPQGTIPLGGGIESLRKSDPKTVNQSLAPDPGGYRPGKEKLSYLLSALSWAKARREGHGGTKLLSFTHLSIGPQGAGPEGR